MAITSFGPNGFTGGGYMNRDGWNSSGSTARIPRAITWGHSGSGSTQSINIHVGNEFGMGAQGGHFYVAGHGWQSDRFFSMIDWQNGGSSGGIVAVRVNDLMTQQNISLAATHDSSSTITLTLTNTHTNGHGWQVAVWGPR